MPPQSGFFQFRKIFPNLSQQILEKNYERKKHMKTTTKFIYVAFAAVTLAIGTVTANAALNDLFASVNGTGDNGGGFIYQYTPTGVQSIFASGLSRPRGVAFDHFANLFVATETCDVSGNCQGSIVKITPDGVQSTFATLSEQNFQPEGMAFDRAGNLFVMAIDLTDPNLASTIYKFTPDGVQSTFGSIEGQSFGLAFDVAGNLFAAGNVNIYKFTPDGTRTVFADSSQFPTNNGPIDLAFDRFGNLFASTESGAVNDPSNVVMKFTPNGVGSTFASNLGNYPRGLAFDRGGNLFVAEVGEELNPPHTLGDILKFTPNGTQTVFAVMPSPAAYNAGPEWLAFQLLPTPRPRPTPHPRPTQQF
jgi:sugar lactone lactonase YvrE